MNKADQISEQIASLQQALVTSNPGMPTMLRTIHQALLHDKDIVTVLTDEEIGVVVSGLMKQTNTVIATAATKKSTKSLRNVSLDDL